MGWPRARFRRGPRPAAERRGALRGAIAGQSICTSAGSREQRLIWRIGFLVSSARSGCWSSAANGCNELASRAAASNERLFAGQQLISEGTGSRCRYVDGRKAPIPAIRGIGGQLVSLTRMRRLLRLAPSTSHAQRVIE